MKVLFIGGTGQISLPCVTEARKVGHEVDVLNRAVTRVAMPEGVTQIHGDTSTADPYRALAGRQYDVVCQFKVFDPAEVARDLAFFRGRAGQYIFISSASVYQKPPRHYVITERTPLENPFWAYSQKKIACETLLRAERELPWTIVRPSHTMRVGLPTLLGEGDLLGQRLLAGKPVIVAGDGQAIWTLTRPVDFAVPFVRLFGKDAALGEDFHITGNAGFSWDAIYSGIAAGLGVAASIVHVPTDTLIRYNSDWTGPLLGDKTWSALFDNSKVRSVAGDFTCSEDLGVVLEEPVQNFRARHEAGLPADPRIDALMDRIAAEQTALGGA